MDLAASIQAVTEEVVLRLTRALAAETGDRQPLPGRRRRAELRGQRQGAARRSRSTAVDPARGRRRRRRARRGAVRLPPVSGAARGRRPASWTPCRAPSWARRSRRRRSRTRLRAVGARFSVLGDEALLERDRRRPGRRQGGRLVPGAHGVRAARARRPLDPGRSARSPAMQSVLNLKVKYRESFRPFAPSVLREDVADWFELDGRQPLHAARRRRGRSSGDAR